LVVLLQTASHTIVLDKTQLSMARRPRQLEIMALLRGFDDCGWLDIAEYRPTLIAQDALPAPVQDAAALLLQDLKKLEDIADFLTLLAPHGQFDIKEFAGPKAPAAKAARTKRRKP
ncbi:MAG TPA: hypothetical protein VFB63_08245, partial [Bryobacteraceae bacterium]|nr:hypothetical protein [Bryobacteraceae bacterium]